MKRSWLILCTLAVLFSPLAPSWAAPAVPAQPTFDALRSAALSDFLRGRDFSGTATPPIRDFYLERAFTGRCRPLAALKDRAEAHLKARNFSNAGASVRYPRETLAASRSQYAGDDLQAFDVVMLVIDIRKADGFSCAYKLGAYARRETPKGVLSPKTSQDLARDLDTTFQDVAASLSATAAQKPERVAELDAWAQKRRSPNALYQRAAIEARDVLVTESAAIGACCGDRLRVYVVSGEALPPWESGGILRNCRAVDAAAGGPAVICSERYLKQVEVIVRAFERLPDEFATSDALMVVMRDMITEPDKFIAQARQSDNGDQSDAHIGRHLVYALLFIAAHEAGHLDAVQAGDFAAARAQPATSAEAEASKMCRHYDDLRESGLRLDVMDAMLRPGGEGQAAWAKVRADLGAEDAVIAEKFRNEAYADQVGTELLVSHIRRLDARDPRAAAEARHLLVETTTALGLGFWHAQLGTMASSGCPRTSFQRLGECFLWDERSYLAANGLFDEFHRNMLQRTFAVNSAVMREASPWFSLPAAQQDIGLPEEAYAALPKAELPAFVQLHADLQRTALLGRLQDMPLKISVAGCMATLVQSGSMSRMARLGLSFVPIEAEMQSVSKYDLGFVATY